MAAGATFVGKQASLIGLLLILLLGLVVFPEREDSATFVAVA